MMPQRPPGSSGPPPQHDDRYRPPSRSAFMHRLPPPIPSASSPHTYPSPGHTDPSSWASASDRERSSRTRYSPIIPSFDRSRLPSLSDYSRQSAASSLGGWDMPNSSTNYPGWKHSTSSYLPSPSKRDIDRERERERDSRPVSQHSHQGHTPLARPSTSIAATTPQASSPGKHGAGDDGSNKKKKRRVALSCAECAKRKQKCNRETPCQHCVARRVPELCIPYTRAGSPPSRGGGKDVKMEDGKVDTSTPVVRQPGMLPTLSVRVARIEALLNAVVNKVDGLEGKALSDWRINHAPATTPPPRNGSLPTSRRDSIRDIDESPSRSPSPIPTGNELESTDATSRDGDEVIGLDMDSSMRNPLPQSMRSVEGAVSLELDEHGTPAEGLQKLFRDCGVSPEKVHELIRELPNEQHANRLLEWFFTKFNHLRYPIDETVFRQSYQHLFTLRGIDPASVLFLPLVFIVFSISTRIAPEEWGLSEAEKRTQSLRFYWHSRNAIIIAKAVKAENVQLVETKILTGLYLVLMHDRRLAEAWAEFRSALTVAQALGMHRDGTKLRLGAYQTEYNRRLWSYLIHADATYSCLLGRPTALDPRFYDTKSPSNLDLAVLENGTRASEVEKPYDEPTFATYLILRRSLGEIVAKLTDHFQMLGEVVQYRDVEELDAEFKAFMRELPRAFRMTEPDKTWDAKLWFLPVHRYYIQTEILHFIIILHRPWLLRKLRSSRYALSRTACIEAAAMDFKIREAFKRDVPDFFETLLASSFREFNVAMIAGISIIISPYTPHLNDMRAILQNFMEQHPHDPSMDDFSKKESAIIYTLHQRATEFEERRLEEQASRPRSGSMLLGTRDNISAERHEPIPQPRPSSSNGLGVSGPNGTPLLGRSPAGLLQKQPGSGTGSPDDDQPQQLLDHWLMSNTPFGPPLSSLDPSQVIYAQPGQATTAGLTEFPAQPVWMDHGVSGMIHNPGLAMAFVPHHPVGNLGMGTPSWGPAGNGEMLPPPQIANVGSDGQPLLGLGVSGMGGQWGDGNSSQYWNTLVDRISGIVEPGYADLSVPSA